MKTSTAELSSNSNTLSYRYGDHIEFVEHTVRSDILAQYIYARFSGKFMFKFRKKIVVGKKDRCALFGCNNDHLFAEKYTVKFSFCPKSASKYCANAPLDIP